MIIEAAILAGGSARRLGGADKRALEVDGITVFDRQLAALRGLASRIVVIGQSAGSMQRSGITAVPDDEPGLGPLGGIHTALMHAASDRVLVLACDLPFVTREFLTYLAETGRECDVTLARDHRGWHPLCASWSTASAPVVRGLLDRGVRAVHQALGALRLHVVEGEALSAFDPDGWLLHNINTPDDYGRASRRTG